MNGTGRQGRIPWLVLPAAMLLLLLPGALHEVRGLVGLPVGGRHVELVRNARLAEDVEGGLDTRLVALGADKNQHVGHSQAASSITL